MLVQLTCLVDPVSKLVGDPMGVLAENVSVGGPGSSWVRSWTSASEWQISELTHGDTKEAKGSQRYTTSLQRVLLALLCSRLHRREGVLTDLFLVLPVVVVNCRWLSV